MFIDLNNYAYKSEKVDVSQIDLSKKKIVKNLLIELWILIRHTIFLIWMAKVIGSRQCSPYRCVMNKIFKYSQ